MLYLSFAGIFLLVTFLALVMQEIAFEFSAAFILVGFIDALGCSFFADVAWIAALIGISLLFIAFYIPSWLKSR